MTSPAHSGDSTLPHESTQVDRQALTEEVLRGLRTVPKSLPPKLFYDETGAHLFEEITKLPEYYLGRAEVEILSARASEIAGITAPNATLIEYGSGAGLKVRLLLNALRSPAAYMPIDISEAQLARVAAEIGAEYPELTIRPISADYTQQLSLPPMPPSERRLAFYPGSTIGNFHPTEASAFLRRIRRTVGSEGSILLGVDRKKDPAVINAAYNDAAGVTSAFNLNLLRRLNRELNANFDLSRFAHHAFFNQEESRVEMHLVSLTTQAVHVAGEEVNFEEGESIWTESSYKYDQSSVDALVSGAGLQVVRMWTDRAELFWVLYLRCAPGAGART